MFQVRTCILSARLVMHIYYCFDRRHKLSLLPHVLGNNFGRQGGKGGHRAETPNKTRGGRPRNRLHRGFSLGRAGSRSPFPAAGRQAAVLGAAPRPSSDHLAGHTAPPTTQCELLGPQGARGAGLRAPRAHFATCRQKRPSGGRAREAARFFFDRNAAEMSRD